MRDFTCKDCEHWHEAEGLTEQGAANDGDIIPGFCYAKPPTALAVQAPNAIGVPQMQITPLRPPVNSNEHACGMLEPRDPPDVEIPH